MEWLRREYSQGNGCTDTFLVGYTAQVEIPTDLMGVWAIMLRFVQRQFGSMHGILRKDGTHVVV